MPSVIAPSRGRDDFSHKCPSDERETEDEYRHRVRVNLFATIALAGLLSVGVWLATEMIDIQKSQGCYVSGQRTCSLI